MPFFHVVGGGSFSDRSGKIHTKDSLPFFDPADLDETFVNVFERVDGPKPRISEVLAPVIKSPLPVIVKEEDEEEVIVKPVAGRTSLGKIVNDQFPLAAENDLLVIAVTNGKFVVTELELPDKPVSPKLTKGKVTAWIINYLSD